VPAPSRLIRDESMTLTEIHSHAIPEPDSKACGTIFKRIQTPAAAQPRFLLRNGVFRPESLPPPKIREAGMLAMKIGYLATGLAFLFVGAITMGVF